MEDSITKELCQHLLLALDKLQEIILDSKDEKKQNLIPTKQLGLYLNSVRMVLVFDARRQDPTSSELLGSQLKEKYDMIHQLVLSSEKESSAFLCDVMENWAKVLEVVELLKRDSAAWGRYLMIKDRTESIQAHLQRISGKLMAPVSHQVFNPYNLILDEKVNAQVEDLRDMREEFMEDLYDTLTQIRCGVSGLTVQEVASSYCEELIHAYVETSGGLPVKILHSITRQVGEIVHFINGDVDWGSYGSLDNYVLNLIYRE